MPQVGLKVTGLQAKLGEGIEDLLLCAGRIPGILIAEGQTGHFQGLVHDVRS